MKIDDNTVVSLSYTLKLDNAEGQLIEQVNDAEPFLFLFGAGGVLPDFETNLRGLEPGKAFEFTIESAKAYGPVSEEAVVQLPLSVFEVDGELQKDLLVEGNYLTLRDHTGQPLRGMVKTVTEEGVTMDFNHPLAGQNLHFSGGVVAVREASADELAHGHVHGEGGHQH